MRRGREAYLGDERVLGSTDFVAALQRTTADALQAPRMALATVITRVCRHLGLASAALTGGGRRTALQRARAGIAYLWVEQLGHTGRPLAGPLGVRPQAVYQAVARGRETRRVWAELLKKTIILLGNVPFVYQAVARGRETRRVWEDLLTK